MNNIQKFQYTNANLFSLSGSPYTGYVNILSGIAWAGKYTQDVALTNNPTAQTSVVISDKFFNRLISQNVSLTYVLSDFVFGSNEFINQNAINLKLQKAQQNYIDTYRACFIGSSNLPTGFTGMAVISSVVPALTSFWNTDTNLWNSPNGFVWAVPYAFVWAPSGISILSNTTLISAYSTITPTSKIAYLTNTYSGNTLIVAGSASLTVFNVLAPTTFTQIFSSGIIQTTTLDSNQLPFDNITGVAYSNNTFYICDAGNQQIYQYDITSVLNQDRTFGDKFNLISIIDNIKGNFVVPSLIEAGGAYVFIFDQASGIINFYDTNFNLINAYKNQKLFAVSVPVSLAYYKLYDQLFVLTADFKLIILDNQANSTIIQLNTTNLASDEVAKKLIFSNSYSDAFYILSNRGMYKNFVSNPVTSIGKFSFLNNEVILTPIWNLNTLAWNNAFIDWNYSGIDPGVSIPGNQLWDIATYDSSNVPYDDIILFAFNGFMQYNETMLFDSILK